jgi:Tol biopolymer transport system component
MTPDALTVVPLGWRADVFYFVLVRTTGTEVWQSNGAVPTKVATISQRPALDARLSPDGRQVAFAAQTADGGSVIGVLDVVSSAIRTVTESRAPLLGPIWAAQGDELSYGVAQVDAQPSSSARRVRASGEGLSALAAPPFEGFDVPLAWNDDGDYLAVRGLVGRSADSISGQQIAIVSTSGARREVQADGWVEFVGWLP